MQDDRERHQQVVSYSIDVYVTLGIITLFAYLAIQFVAPFVSVILWALILAVALFPVFEAMRRGLGGRGAIAAALIAGVGLVFILGPAAVIIQSMVATSGHVAAMLETEHLTVPLPPDSVRNWPLIGGMVHDFWTGAHEDLQRTAEHFAPQLQRAAGYLLEAGAGLVLGVAQFALSIVLAAVLLSNAGPLGALSDRLAGRIASSRGRAFVTMSVTTIRNVSRGVIGVALIQGGLAGLVMVAVGLPYWGILTALVTAASILQFPILVILPTIVYAWSAEPTSTALIYTVLIVPVLLVDNVLKPIIMAHGLTTPMAVILLGVIGGTVSAGLVGLFIGPVVLAVFYDMIRAWVASMETAP